MLASSSWKKGTPSADFGTPPSSSMRKPPRGHAIPHSSPAEATGQHVLGWLTAAVLTNAPALERYYAEPYPALRAVEKETDVPLVVQACLYPPPLRGGEVRFAMPFRTTTAPCNETVRRRCRKF